MGASTAPIPISENCMFSIVVESQINDNKGSGGKEENESWDSLGFKRAPIVRCSRVCESYTPWNHSRFTEVVACFFDIYVI